MFAETQFLKENLDTERRGEAIARVSAKLAADLSGSQWDGAVDFLWEYERTFSGNTSILNIVSTDFSALVDAFLSQGAVFGATMSLHQLSNMHWFDGIGEPHAKRGVIAERMAGFGSGIVEVLKLREARAHYRSAQRTEDVRRVQERLSARVKTMGLSPSPLLPPDHPIAVALSTSTKDALDAWDKADNPTKLQMLVCDFAGVRPLPYSPELVPTDDIYLHGFLEEVGAIVSVGVSTDDGRVNAGRMPPSRERIHDKSWDAELGSFLTAFSGPVVSWLKTQDGDRHVCAIVSATMRKSLEWEDSATEYFMEALTAWVSGYPQIALSLWLPFFENALRMQLASLGEDVISPQPKPGIEDFVVFDTLLRKAGGHYDCRTVEYWRKILCTSNGLGLNLRNAYCHGLLPIGAMRSDSLALAVFMAYLFLCVRGSTEDEAAQTEQCPPVGSDLGHCPRT
jgi:hypothetical protein